MVKSELDFLQDHMSEVFARYDLAMMIFTKILVNTFPVRWQTYDIAEYHIKGTKFAVKWNSDQSKIEKIWAVDN